MSKDLNRCYMIARLCKDPELSTTTGGTSVCKFSVANNDSYTKNGEKKETVSFFNVVCWGKTGEVINQYCKKGSKIAIEGRLIQRRWEKDGKHKSKTKVYADCVMFVGSRKDREQQ